MPTEDSTLFSLDRLTEKNSAQRTSARDEDSSLIDLSRLTDATRSATAPSPAAPSPLGLFGPPPPLGGAEESTLNGVSAVNEPPRARWSRVALYGTGLLLCSLGVGLFAASTGSDAPRAPGAPATVIVYATAPAATPASQPDRTQLRDEPPAEPGVVDSSGPSDPVTASQPKPAPKRAAPGSPARKPQAEPNPARPERKPAAKKDPCAHCGGDLSCAMRCSVKNSG